AAHLDQNRWAADVGEPEVTHAGFGTLECSLAHESTKSATSSQPSCPGKWQRPGYSRESVPDAAWRCFLKLARFTDGGQMRSSVPVTSRSGGRLGFRESTLVTARGVKFAKPAWETGRD